MLTWLQLRVLEKGIGLLNVGGFYGPFRDMVDHIVAEGFAKMDTAGSFCVVCGSGPSSLVSLVANFGRFHRVRLGCEGAPGDNPA